MFERWLSLTPGQSYLVLGPRRSGKTTLLRARFPDYKYATLDDLDYLSWAQQDPKGFVLDLGKQAIIDEIQRAPKLTVAVKYAIDNQGSCFIMTGSSSLKLLDAASDTLAGRIDIKHLPTACFGEEQSRSTHSLFKDQLNPAQIKKAHRLLNRAIEYGQFPEVLTQADDDARHKILNVYKNSYFTRDLMQLANLENQEGLLAIFHNLARSLGSHLEVSNFARESALSFPTTKKYLNALGQSQLTFRLLGYQYGPTKRFIKAAKTYFCDNGIIHGLGTRVSKGQLLENFVIAEIEKRRKLGFIQCDQLYYYKSAAGREIDLVFEDKGRLYAVEIKSTTNPADKDISRLKKFRDEVNQPVDCILFYTGEEYGSIDGVKLIPVAALRCGV
ncbi:MAG: ATP-binding protein [Myxococcota bacterium]|nr:ATP-binding protein [Myxococcota bacterium]